MMNNDRIAMETSSDFNEYSDNVPAKMSREFKLNLPLGRCVMIVTIVYFLTI